MSRPVAPQAGTGGAGDRKGRPYGTNRRGRACPVPLLPKQARAARATARVAPTARTAGDGLVPSRCSPSRHGRHGRPQGSPLRHEPQGTGLSRPVAPQAGTGGAGDRKGRPYGTNRRGRACPVPLLPKRARAARATARVAPTARTAGDGLVPSRCSPSGHGRRGRPQGSPLRHEPQGTGLSRPVAPQAGTGGTGARVAPTARNRRGRACPVPLLPKRARAARTTARVAPTARTVGDGLVPSRRPTGPRWRGRPQGSPLRHEPRQADNEGEVRQASTRTCPWPGCAALKSLEESGDIAIVEPEREFDTRKFISRRAPIRRSRADLGWTQEQQTIWVVQW